MLKGQQVKWSNGQEIIRSKVKRSKGQVTKLKGQEIIGSKVNRSKVQ